MSPRKLPMGMDLFNEGHTVWRLVNKVFPGPMARPRSPMVTGGRGAAQQRTAALPAWRMEVLAGSEEQLGKPRPQTRTLSHKVNPSYLQ